MAGLRLVGGIGTLNKGMFLSDCELTAMVSFDKCDPEFEGTYTV